MLFACSWWVTFALFSASRKFQSTLISRILFTLLTVFTLKAFLHIKTSVIFCALRTVCSSQCIWISEVVCNSANNHVAVLSKKNHSESFKWEWRRDPSPFTAILQQAFPDGPVTATRQLLLIRDSPQIFWDYLCNEGFNVWLDEDKWGDIHCRHTVLIKLSNACTQTWLDFQILTARC